MAGNPDWCLSYEEWQRKFSYWILKPDPKALLNAMIFFDFRPLWGEESLAENLRGWLLQAIQGKAMFVSNMAADALSCRPPLGMFRDFIVDNGKKGPAGTIDLKLYGSRPFVDAARLLALVAGVPHTNTAERLRGVAGLLRLDDEQVEAMIEGFYFVYLTRLRVQIEPGTATGNTNRVDPYQLNDMNRQMLKESFKQARKLQSMIEADPRFALSPERLR
jgi:CBS domain-containing protein